MPDRKQSPAPRPTEGHLLLRLLLAVFGCSSFEQQPPHQLSALPLARPPDNSPLEGLPHQPLHPNKDQSENSGESGPGQVNLKSFSLFKTVLLLSLHGALLSRGLREPILNTKEVTMV